MTFISRDLYNLYNNEMPLGNQEGFYPSIVKVEGEDQLKLLKEKTGNFNLNKVTNLFKKVITEQEALLIDSSPGSHRLSIEELKAMKPILLKLINDYKSTHTTGCWGCLRSIFYLFFSCCISKPEKLADATYNQLESLIKTKELQAVRQFHPSGEIESTKIFFENQDEAVSFLRSDDAHVNYFAIYPSQKNKDSFTLLLILFTGEPYFQEINKANFINEVKDFFSKQNQLTRLTDKATSEYLGIDDQVNWSPNNEFILSVTANGISKTFAIPYDDKLSQEFYNRLNPWKKELEARDNFLPSLQKDLTELHISYTSNEPRQILSNNKTEARAYLETAPVNNFTIYPSPNETTHLALMLKLFNGESVVVARALDIGSFNPRSFFMQLDTYLNLEQQLKDLPSQIALLKMTLEKTEEREPMIDFHIAYKGNLTVFSIAKNTALTSTMWSQLEKWRNEIDRLPESETKTA